MRRQTMNKMYNNNNYYYYLLLLLLITGISVKIILLHKTTI